MRERRLPRTRTSVSEVGLRLPGPRAGSPGGTPTPYDLAVAQGALERGFRLFDLTASPAPSEAAKVLAAHLPREARFSLILPVGERGPLADAGGAGRPDLLPRETLAPETVAALAEDPSLRSRLLAELVVGPGEDPAAARELTRLREQGSLLGWGAVPGPETSSLDGVARLLRDGGSWLRVPVHLLLSSALEAARPIAREAGVGLLAVDPFAGGRLDGSFLEAHRLEAEGPPRPSDLATLRRELGPVTRLGFLTRDRRRTLPQAAALYALRPAEVVSVLVPARSVREVEALARLEELPPVSDEEVAELARALALPPDAGSDGPAGLRPQESGGR